MSTDPNDPTIISFDQVRAAAAVLGVKELDGLREVHMSPQEVRFVRAVEDENGETVVEDDEVATTTTTVRVAGSVAETTARVLQEQAAALRAELEASR